MIHCTLNILNTRRILSLPHNVPVWGQTRFNEASKVFAAFHQDDLSTFSI